MTNRPTGRLVYTAPPPGLIPGLIAELLAQLNAEDGSPAHVRAAMAHLNLTAIHPFLDGNGRQVATGTSQTGGDAVMVTCNGGSPQQLSQACTASSDFGSEECTTGTCTY